MTAFVLEYCVSDLLLNSGNFYLTSLTFWYYSYALLYSANNYLFCKSIFMNSRDRARVQSQSMLNDEKLYWEF